MLLWQGSGRRLSSQKLWSEAGMGDTIGFVCCVLLAATAAGLTMGIVSFDALELRVVMRTGTAQEKKDAKRLLRFVDREPRHQVLVTLLLLNSVANEAMPIFLDSLVPTWAAVVLSVTAVLFVGEIVPSAIFTGPQKLRVAAFFSPVVTVALALLYPLSWPISTALDALLPEDEEKKYTSRSEVRALVDVQRDDAHQHGAAEPFSEDEADLVRGAMSLSSTSVRDVMIPADRVFTLRADAPLDVRAIYNAGFSRIPVVDAEGNYVGRYLLVKDVLMDIGSDVKVETLPMRDPVWVGPNHSLFDLLNEFQTGRTHMAFVSSSNAAVVEASGNSVLVTRHRSLLRRSASFAGGGGGARKVLGILTLEDVLEQILTEPIYDEADRANAAQVIRRFMFDHVLPYVRDKNHDNTSPLLHPAARHNNNIAAFPRLATIPSSSSSSSFRNIFSELPSSSAGGDASAAHTPTANQRRPRRSRSAVSPPRSSGSRSAAYRSSNRRPRFSSQSSSASGSKVADIV